MLVLTRLGRCFLSIDMADELANCNSPTVMVNDVFQDMFSLIWRKSRTSIFQDDHVVAKIVAVTQGRFDTYM